jgi:hypothetical protein
MAKFISLVVLALSLSAEAQIFQNPFGGRDEKKAGESSALEKVLSELEALEASGGFEERYRVLSIEIERQLDLKRGDCGESTANKSDKQRCFRSIVSSHKRYLERGFSLKKVYLQKLHERQLTALEEAKARALSELERQF